MLARELANDFRATRRDKVKPTNYVADPKVPKPPKADKKSQIP